MIQHHKYVKESDITITDDDNCISHQLSLYGIHTKHFKSKLKYYSYLQNHCGLSLYGKYATKIDPEKYGFGDCISVEIFYDKFKNKIELVEFIINGKPIY